MTAAQPQHRPDAMEQLRNAAVINAQTSRDILRSENSTRMALEGLTLAIEQHIAALVELQPKLNTANEMYSNAKERAAKRGRPRRPRLRAAKKLITRRRELTADVNGHTDQIMFFRSLLVQQIEDTAEFGHEALSAQYADRMLELRTPLEQSELDETIAVSARNQELSRIWRAILDKVRELVDTGRQHLPALQEALTEFQMRHRQVLIYAT